MARKRQLDPEYPFEEEIARLSVPARYFYILSWCHMDDTNGVLPYNAYKLKGQIFPDEDIDVEAIIKELTAAKRLFEFKAEGKKWLWCPKLLKHQTINHPSKKKYPDPPKTLKEHYRSTKVALTQSRVEESRVEKRAEASPALKAALNKISKNGLNIYTLINKLKKQMSMPKDFQFPEEVLLGVCRSYEHDKAKIDKPWPWFVRVIKAETGLWNAQKEINLNKKNQGMAQSFKDILKGIG